MAHRINRNTLLLFLILFFVNMLFLAFYTFSNNDDDCSGVEILKFIDTGTIGGEGYTLFLRQTGFQDKIQFLLLFPEDILFDHCGRPVEDELAYVTIDYAPDNGPIVQWPEKIEIKNRVIKIHYTQDKEKQKPIIDVPVIWYQGTGDAHP